MITITLLFRACTKALVKIIFYNEPSNQMHQKHVAVYWHNYTSLKGDGSFELPMVQDSAQEDLSSGY